MVGMGLGKSIAGGIGKGVSDSGSRVALWRRDVRYYVGWSWGGEGKAGDGRVMRNRL